MAHILVVEDEPDLAALVAFNLRQANFEVDIAETGEQALDLASRNPPHLVILDLMLPDISGVEVCRAMKKRAPSVPVVMLTAKKEESDRLAGFQSGAEDYIVKPFSVLELVLRVKAILRRAGLSGFEAPNIRFGVLDVDVSEHRCTVDGTEVPLTVLEFRLLHYLLARLGQVQSRKQLLEEVWKLQGSLETRTIDTHINRLRQKLGNAGDYLETVRGVGYRIKKLPPEKGTPPPAKRPPVARRSI
ncbi:MAG TPA: response regulator transcription factor [Myxococcaceae bacterium]|nr:response regulator transcription factor [Myxococcaceae bacterium]